MANIDWEMFDAPFEDNEIEWRIQHVIEDKQLGLAVPYIDNRAIQRRLDKVVGKPNWKNEYSAAPAGGVLCGISIRCEDGDWVTKFDGADNTDYEPTKGGLSDSMKRCAVQWGMGRYLYDVEPIWCPVEKKGKNWKLVSKPSLNAKSRISDPRPNRLDMESPSSEKPAQAKGAKVARPMSATVLYESLRKKAAQIKNDPKDKSPNVEISEGQSKTLNIRIGDFSPYPGDRDLKIYLLQQAFGTSERVFTTSKQLLYPEMKALLEWLTPSPEKGVTHEMIEEEFWMVAAEASGNDGAIVAEFEAWHATQVERDLASNG